MTPALTTPRRRDLLTAALIFVPAATAMAQVPRREPRQARSAAEWRRLVSAALQRRKRYPAALTRRSREAGEASPSGTAQLLFTVARDGRILDAALTRRTGHPELDGAVLAMAPPGMVLPRLPPDIDGESHQVSVPVTFVGAPAPDRANGD